MHWTPFKGNFHNKKKRNAQTALPYSNHLTSEHLYIVKSRSNNRYGNNKRTIICVALITIRRLLLFIQQRLISFIGHAAWRQKMDYQSCCTNEEFRVHCTKERCTSSDLRISRNYSPKTPRLLRSYSRILFPVHSASSESVTLCSCLYGTPLFITVRTNHYAGICPKQVNQYSFLNTLWTGLLNCLNARSRGLTFRHSASCI